MNYLELRKKYPEFVYDNYSWKLQNSQLLIQFKFSTKDVIFNHKLIVKDVSKLSKNIDNSVFNIGLVEMLSYWKAFCSSKIVVNAGYLDEYQIKWWKKLLINGMGQYFFENKIDFTPNDFIEIESTSSAKVVNLLKIEGEAILVPIGGGKDSTVTLEILKNNFSGVSGFLLNPSKASHDTAKVASVKTYEVVREFDQKLIDLNSKGYLNGHVPFTATLSFVSVFVAIITNNKYIVFSNEQSSNEDNVKYLNRSINHQYSKSFEFENDFREYNNKYLSDINYFSFLRPIYDIQIAKIFSKLDKYFSVVRSCNIGQKTDTWCGKCPKCLSTFTLLYPFMKDNAVRIFGKNLLEDESLKSMLELLTNDNNVKPFECVGTRHELRVALEIEKDNELMKFWSEENNLPEKFKEVLQKEI